MSGGASVSRQFAEAVAEYVRQRTGLVFREARRGAFEAGLVAAMRRAKAAEPESYLTSLGVQPELLDDLVGEITIGETYFFREPQQFAFIRQDVIPALCARAPKDRILRVWSAACATGEEPYTLAILLREEAPERGAHVVATDISRGALAKARRAVYTKWSLRGVSDEVVHTYFTTAGSRFALAPAIRAAVDFRYLNLAEDTYPSLPTGIWGMDLILCRNVLIYFDAETIARVARRLIDSLGDDGWLLLGASDPPLGELVPCEVVITDAGLAYRRRGRGTVWRGPTTVSSPVSAVLPLPQLTDPVVPEPPQPSLAPQAAGELQPLVLRGEASAGGADAARSYAKRDYERAAAVAGRLVQGDGTDPSLWIVLVRALANRGELQAAGRACAAALDRHRASAELAYLHAVLLMESGCHADAAAAARRALYLDRGLVVGHLALGGALARLEDAEGARRAIRNAQQLLAGMAPDDLVPASDGERAGRLAQMAAVQLALLRGVAA
jgi:chemotaxis protein methyltransferase CheR